MTTPRATAAAFCHRIDRSRRFLWFAVFAPTAPHGPSTPSPEHADDFDGVSWDPPALNEADASDKPTWIRDLPPQDRRRMRKIYEGKLEELQDVDDQVASVLNVLWRTGQLRRTWIFFVSDNGYLLGEHRLFHKSQPYEESAGIPFLVRGPGVRPLVTGALVVASNGLVRRLVERVRRRPFVLALGSR